MGYFSFLKILMPNQIIRELSQIYKRICIKYIIIQLNRCKRISVHFKNVA